MNKRAPKRTDTERLRAALQECADCLEDVASGKGGWAWEEVLDNARAALDATKPE
jgi:hypothetical protein